MHDSFNIKEKITIKKTKKSSDEKINKISTNKNNKDENVNENNR